MAESSQSKHLVVVGASAGGIEALTAFLAELPRDFAAPIVIAQHLDPSRPSHLAEILGRRSPLEVRTVTQSEPLRPGIVYVVPSNRHIHISDSHLELSQEDTNRSKPSIDYLFSSAAQRFGEGLIAVVLTGTGSDGAAGARIVKEAGGTVIIQDPTTAAYPGMPLSLAPNIVDIVAPVDRMGRVLSELMNGAKAPTQPGERKLLDDLLQDVRERLGLDFNSYKTPTILRRLQRRVVATDADNIQGYLNYLHAHPEEYQNLTNAFLIKVTEFFRDPDLYAYLRENVVPDLIAQSRKHGNDLRIWSAGCATGEEAYSVAVVISEVLGAALEHFNVRVFATDADPDAIAFARRGIYPASALARVPEELVTKYFTREEGNYQIRKRIRALTIFGQHDLGGRAPFPHIDLIVCRNVLIYFTPDLQQRTLKLFAYSLRDGGYLVLGKAETPGQMSDFFDPQNKLLKVYQRRGDRILIPPARTSDVLPAPPQQRLPMVRRTPGGLAFNGGPRDLQRIRTSADTLLLRIPVGVVIVDRRYDIQMINSAARRFLSIHGSAVGEDLIHVEQGIPTAQLREAIDQAFRSGQQTTIEEIAVEEVAASEPHYLHVSCIPQQSDNERGTVDSVMVVIQDVTTQVQARRVAEQELGASSETLQQLRQDTEARASEREQLVQRLVETNQQLIEANQELTSTNEELRTTNEEFLLSAEEAQAAIEEVETLNEELQATNEELETLNEELQATIEELNATNDDLNARTVELQEMANTSAQARAQLEAILLSLADAVLVVNGSGATQLTNAAYERMFGSNLTPLVPDDENGVPLPNDQTPQQRAARGETFVMEFTAVGVDGVRRLYEANGKAIEGGTLARGGVVAIRDITERSLHRLQDEFLTLASHELRTPLTPLQSALQALRKQLGDRNADAGQTRLVDVALRQASRLARLVGDLVDVRRLQSGKFSIERQRFRIDEIVARAVEAAQLLNETVPIHLQIADAPLVLDGDPGRIEQVVLNLVANAVTHAAGKQGVDVGLRRTNGDAELQVRDHGLGIPPADLPHVFSRFYQVESAGRAGQEGLGLGLYIAKEIVEAHGGTIGVASTQGHGTTFTVRLPLTDRNTSPRR